MQIHLVDATYELFRAHYAPRPPVLGRDGVVLSGVSGLCDQLLYLLREEGATHVGVRHGPGHRVVPQRPVPGYKSSAGMDPELLAQFPIAEAAIEALGVVLWPMVEFEADDAIGAAAARFAADPAVERILICTPDKDMAQCVVGERIVLWDRRRGITYDEAGVLEKWGVEPASIPDWLALVGDSSDGFPGLPGWGAKSAAAVLRRLRLDRAIPPRAAAWDVPGVTRRRRASPRSSREQHDEAILYRTLARLRTSTTASRSPSRPPRSSSGTARRGRPGRRSATSGAWTGCGRDRIAGSGEALTERPAARAVLAASARSSRVVGRRRGDAPTVRVFRARSNQAPPSKR